MQLNLQIVSREKGIPKKKDFSRWAKAALAENPEAEITIRIVDSAEIQKLNAKYRHKDKPTNVLSFQEELPSEIDIPLLGDIVICAPIINQEAKKQGKELTAHWAHITIHGILHLLGYDHIEMEPIEIKLLAKLGFANPY